MLTDAQLERYSRQILLPEVGGRGQERLLAATVTLARGGVAATLLGRAGVGRLVLVDPVGVPPREPSPDCLVERHGCAGDAPLGDVVVDLTDATDLGARAATAGKPFVVGAAAATSATLATLVGRPCRACVPTDVLAPPDGGAPGP